MREGERESPISVGAVVAAAMILKPSRMGGVGVEEFGRDVMVLARDHPAKAGEEGLGHVRVDAVEAVGDPVIDAVGGERAVQHVPMACFVSDDLRALGDDAWNERDPCAFGRRDKGHGPAATLAGNDHDAALVALVLWKATVLPVSGLVGRANVATKVGSVDLDFASQRCAANVARQRFADLVSQHESRLGLNVQIAAQLERREPLGGVRHDAESGQNVGKAQLAAMEKCPAGDAVLSVAVGALEATAGRDPVGAKRAALGQTGSPSVPGQRSLQKVE